MYLALILASFSFYGGLLGGDVPAGINKCVLKYPEVYKCIEDEANRIIPFLVKGNEEMGLLPLSPVNISKAELHAPDFNLTLTDVYFDNFKDFKVAHPYFHLDHKNVSVLFKAPILNFVSNYEIKEGKFLSRRLTGNGRCNITLVDNVMIYKSNMTYRVVNNETYFTLTDIKFALDVRRGHFYFENLKSSEHGEEMDDTQEFINKHWGALLDMVKMDLLNFLLQVIHSAVSRLELEIPLEKLFIYEENRS